MRIVFMGTPAFAVPSLVSLLNTDYSVVGVVTQPDRPQGRHQSLVPSPIKHIAQTHGLPLLQPDKMNHPLFLEQLQRWQPDIIAVTAFGRILQTPILTLPPMGCVNVHGSLLPQYRGASPIQWALINGDRETGITTMLMDEGMDTGPILLQQTVTIEPTDTVTELGNRLAEIGGMVLCETLKDLVAGRLTPRSQDHAQATYTSLLKKEDGLINWACPAQALVNRLRGLAPWPGSYTFADHTRLVIWQASVDTHEDTHMQHLPGTIIAVGAQAFWVATGDGTVKVTDVQPVNKKRMSVGAFLQGYPLRVGMILKAAQE